MSTLNRQKFTGMPLRLICIMVTENVLPGPFRLSYSVFDFIVFLVFRFWAVRYTIALYLVSFLEHVNISYRIV